MSKPSVTAANDRDVHIPLSQAGPFFPGNPHRNTVARWAYKGLYGKKLKTIRFGGKRLTRRDWIEQFKRDMFGASPDVCADSPTAAHQIAEAKLDSLLAVQTSHAKAKSTPPATSTSHEDAEERLDAADSPTASTAYHVADSKLDAMGVSCGSARRTDANHSLGGRTGGKKESR